MSEYPRSPVVADKCPPGLTLDRPARVDLITKNSAAVYDISGVDVLTYQADALDFAWATSAVITLTFSNNGRSWYAHPSGSLTITSSSLAGPVDVGGFRFVRFQVTTEGSGTSPQWAEISVWGRARPIVGTI